MPYLALLADLQNCVEILKSLSLLLGIAVFTRVESAAGVSFPVVQSTLFMVVY